MIRYQGLCYENMKRLKLTLSTGKVVGAQVISASTPPATSSSKAPIEGGLRNDSEGARRGTAPGCGGAAACALASSASSSSPSAFDVALTLAAARDIVDRFVKEGAPEQVK